MFHPSPNARAQLLPLAALAAVSGVLLIWNGLLVYQMATTLHMNDFGKFYYSARAFLDGQDMYEPTPPTLIPVGDGRYFTFLNLNPPHFHLPLIPLALLPPELALAVWGAASLVALAASLLLIGGTVGLRPTPVRVLAVLAAALGFSGTGAVSITGQLSFLLLLPLTLAWTEARRGRWARAGMWLGLALSVKSFLLIFLPYLVLQRRHRAAGVTLGTAGACFALGLVVFGIDAHLSWLRALGSSDWAWAAMNGSILGFLTRALDRSSYYAPIAVVPGLVKPAWLVLSTVVGLLTLLAAWRRPHESAVDRDFALLLLGALLISPLGWVYYLWLPVGPLAGLVVKWRREARARESGRVTTGVWWRRGLLAAAIPGLVWPLLFTTVFGPQPWATATVGSIYFWTTLALWLALMADWLIAIGRRGREASVVDREVMTAEL